MQTRTLKIILLVAAAVRLALLASAWKSPARLFAPDSHEYVELSANLVESGEFQLRGQTEIFRTPGYPVLLIVALPSAGFWAQGAALLQIALDVLLVYLTFLLGMMVCGERVGLWAAALQAVNPVAIASSVRILSDGLFTFLLVLAILLLVHHLKTGRWWSLICFSLIGGLSCYVRPVGLGFLAACLLVLAARAVWSWGSPRERRRARALLAPLAAAALMAAAVLPWAVRNYLVADYCGFSSVAAEGAFGYQAPAVLSEVEGISLDQARARLGTMLSRSSLPEHPSAGDLARAKLACAREVLRREPGAHARVHVRGDLAVWVPAATDILEILGVTTGGKGTLEVLRRDGPWAAARHYFRGAPWALWLSAPLVVIQAAGYALAVIAVFLYARFRMDSSRWLMLLVIAVFALVPGPAGHPRFQTPIVPLLSVVAAAGAVWLRGLRGSPRGSGL